MYLTHHKLLTNQPQASLDFYQNLLGMQVINSFDSQDGKHYQLSFEEVAINAERKQALLELIDISETEQAEQLNIAPQPSQTEGYWKFSIAVNDLEATREDLINKGLSQIGECFQVSPTGELAYLCHLQDPNGYCIELIQKTLKSNPIQQSDSPTLNLSTIRVKNAEKSIQYYEKLGMSLIYTFRADMRGMSLYFLIDKAHQPVLDAIPANTIEEKMWQFPHTILELQQFDGTADNEDFAYRVNNKPQGIKTGFVGLSLAGGGELDNLDSLGKDTAQKGILYDPDGYELVLG